MSWHCSKPEIRYPRAPMHVEWVKKHFCSVPDCKGDDIFVVHLYDTEKDGVIEFTCDRYVVSMCRNHRNEFYDLGEKKFQRAFRISLEKIAEEFFAVSPYKKHLFIEET